MEQDKSGPRLYSLIMAGGKGTRFWPESTSKKPKQYLSLTSEKTLLEETLSRFDGMVEKRLRYIVTTEDQAPLAKECSKKVVGEKGLIFEPAGRNTAPCILLALARLEAEGATDDDVVSIVPSDHVILNTVGFRETLQRAYEIASEKKSIVTIGVQPHFPHTGFGYIEKGEEETQGSFRVKAFKEKPDFETAKSYLESGNYYWNAGMFVAGLGTLKNEFKQHAPDMYEYYEKLLELEKDPEKRHSEELKQVYENLRKDSIDYAVMEKTHAIRVVPAAFDWNDLGSWDALESVIEPTEGNTLVASNGHQFREAKGNIVFAPEKYVALVNVNDLIVVSNERALMVLPKTEAQEVKNIVASIKGTDQEEDLL